jgi:hypothetical protein
MDQRVTVLPIAPEYFWPGVALFGLLLATGLVYGVLALTDLPQALPVWDGIHENGRVLTIVLGLLWLGLFGLTIWAAQRRPLGTRVRRVR